MSGANIRRRWQKRAAASVTVGAALGLTASGALAPVPGDGAHAAGRVTAAVVRPLPLAPDHVLQTSIGFAPDTAFCKKQFHLACYRPAQLQAAYGVAPLLGKGLDGRGRTIVIVDSFGSPTIAADLHYFDRTLGLPDPPSFKVIQPAGAVPVYPQDPFGKGDRSGWALETSLDVEYAHAMAPGANIVLVETPTAETEGVQGFPEIVKAENYVIDHHLGDVISMSLAATEQTFPSSQSLMNLRSAFLNAQRHNVTVVASSGDYGATSPLSDGTCCYPYRVTSWPATDPLVTAVGGTQLHLDAAGHRSSPDNVWNDQMLLGTNGQAGGGGVSTIFPRPKFQDGVGDLIGSFRGVPDVSLSAAVDGAAIVYYSFCDYKQVDGSGLPKCGPEWRLVGGTSEAAPLLSGIVAIGAQAAHHSLGWLNPRLYSTDTGSLSAGVVDVTAGNNTLVYCVLNCADPVIQLDVPVPGYPAAKGYDLASGLGTIDAGRFVQAAAHGG